MSEFLGVMGYFSDADALKNAVEAAHREHLRRPVTYSPLPDEEALEILRPGTSPIRWTCLLGGLAGMGIGWAMTVWMSFDYPLVVGGKPFVSWPPYAVIVFELTILFASLGTVAGFLVLARLPRQNPSAGYRPSFSIDEFALFLKCDEESEERRLIERILRESGADRVVLVRSRDDLPIRRST